MGPMACPFARGVCHGICNGYPATVLLAPASSLDWDDATKEVLMNATNKAFMLDTTVFNDLRDGKIVLSSFAGARLLVTGIQLDELRATKDPSRRECLLAMFEQVDPSVEPASSFAFDIEGAGFDQAYWNDGSGTIERMLQRLQELDPSRKSQLNQLRDVLIAETAIKIGAILISGDEKLRKVVCEFGGQSAASP